MGIRLEVDDEFMRTGGGAIRPLRLALGIGIDHGFGQQLDEVYGKLLAGLVLLDVFLEGFGGVEHLLEAGVLVGIFLGREGPVAALEQAGYGAIFRFDDLANLVALGVLGMDLIAQVGVSILDELDLVRDRVRDDLPGHGCDGTGSLAWCLTGR